MVWYRWAQVWVEGIVKRIGGRGEEGNRCGSTVEGGKEGGLKRGEWRDEEKEDRTQ